MALKANPNILECLYTPIVEYVTPLAQELLDKQVIDMGGVLHKALSLDGFRHFSVAEGHVKRDFGASRGFSHS
jgi:hypothetical protein